METQDQPQERIEFRTDKAWAERVRAQARRLRMNLSAYIRMVVTERIEQEEGREADRG